MKTRIRQLVVAVILSGSAVAFTEFETEAFLIVRRVVDRMLDDTSDNQEILCVNCDAQAYEDVAVRLHKERPYVPMIRIVRTNRTIADTYDIWHDLRRPSLILQICVNDWQCRWDDTLLYSNPNKYAIFIQLFYGTPISEIRKHANELVTHGVLKVFQFVAPVANHAKPIIYVTGALKRKWVPVYNRSYAENLLFDGTLMNFRGFVYEVGLVPLMSHMYTTNNRLHNVEISNFLTVLEKQGARYRYRLQKSLSVLLPSLLSGNLHVILNAVEMNGNFFEKAYWKDIQQFCIVLPRRYERMHMQLLLTPFKWQIWMVIVLIIAAIQLVSLLFPERVSRYLILKCFFGGGEPEHTLSTGNRLIVCVICVLIFLFTETYQAILLSLMSADPFVKNPETIEEFIEENHTLIVLRGSSYEMPSALNRLIKEVNETDVYMTLQNASVVSCDLAHYLNTNPFLWSLPVKADLIVIKPRVYYRAKYIVFSWTCPATREYQRYMDRIYEVGLYQKEQHKWFPKKMYNKREQTFNDLIVLTDDLIPVWELLGTGLSLALACFVGEIVLHRLFYLAKQSTSKAKSTSR